MGGRRARSVVEIVGTGLGTQRAQVTKALSNKDPEALATSSARLLSRGEKTTDIIYYAARLAKFVQKEVESGRSLTHEERVKRAREEWSRIKKEENLPDDPIVTQALVFAAAKAIGKGKK